ncbi:MAG: choice-of-anchor J domain-containing protein [Bacteroides sp.]|nr:choice-of-anchor J domain-containing protein [Ruminococcus flavefaciens]MCM1555094.1 choice-of-anchor J domain-containing protein [Bacteroides sp.]
MKKFFLALGLSATILLSAALGQPAAKMQPAASGSVKKIETTGQVDFKQWQKQNPELAKKLGINTAKRLQGALTLHKPQPTASIQHVSTIKSDNPDKATVKLTVGNAWGDGSGYQVLLDADAKFCDDLSTDDGCLPSGLIQNYYDQAEGKIPANATPEVGKTSILDKKEASLDIDGGIYDILVVNPAIEEDEFNVWIVGGNALWDNFQLMAGYTYTFSVSINWDIPSEDCTLDLPLNISADRINLPAVSCEIGSEANVTLHLSNNGSADINSYKVWYQVEGSSDVVTETVSTVLPAGKQAEYTFNKKISVADPDSIYTVYGGLVAFEGDASKADDTVTGCIIKRSAVNVPYTFDIGKYDLFGQPIAWNLGKEAVNLWEPGYPLMSRCVNLEEGKTYRISCEFYAGIIFLGFLPLPETYHVGFGRTSTPFSEWDTVASDEQYLSSDWAPLEFTVRPQESGTYAFYFQADEIGFFGIRDVSISEVAAHDARLSSISTGLARLIPADQANGSFTASVAVQNRGYENIDEAEVSISLNGNIIGNSKIKDIKPNLTKSTDVSITTSGLKINDLAKFTATVTIQGEDENHLSDNAKEQTIEITDVDMVYDYVTEDMYTDRYSIGTDGGSVGCGIPFSLSQKDTLTAVSFGWEAFISDLKIGIRIQKWNKETFLLDDPLYDVTVYRGTEAGQHSYKTPAIILEAGDYMISAIQLTAEPYGLITDARKDGTLYVTTNYPVTFMSELGTPSIRAVFGHDGKPMKKDVYVAEITSPQQTGIFANNQVITARILNQGYEQLEAPLTLMVDGKTVGNKTVTLKPYEQTEVLFIADLSTPNTEYELTVFSSLADDEDPSNDKCTKKVKSLQPADPYVMDWENCEDFSTNGFNPVWKAVDEDGAPTYGFQTLYFPHMEEAFAFIAFNPNVLEGADEHMMPHSGQRFGASFCSSAGVNNDWLISPKLKIIEGKAFMSFFVKTYNDAYGLERYKVLVSETDDAVSSFTQIGETLEAPSQNWAKVEIDLNKYAGKEVHLAIQCLSEDQLMFMIDDITVCTSLSNEGVAKLSSLLSLYPNPAHETIIIHAVDVAINEVAIYNPAGILLQHFNDLNTTDFIYNVRNLAAGVYFARVATEQGVAVLKFMVR